MRALAWLALSAALALPAGAAPLVLGYGRVVEGLESEPGTAVPVETVAEHLEFLLAHGWTVAPAAELAAERRDERTAVLVFDDPASFLRLVKPLLDVHELPAAVSVGSGQIEEAETREALRRIAADPRVAVLVRADDLSGPGPALDCAGAAPVGVADEAVLSDLAGRLARATRLLAELELAPLGVVWPAGSWSGPAEAVARAAGLAVQVPTFAVAPPPLEPPRAARILVGGAVGIWAPVQASVGWNPSDHPVRFVEVPGEWFCGSGDPQGRLGEVVEVIDRWGLNAVRLQATSDGRAWFPTSAMPVGAPILPAVVAALRARTSVRWVVVDLPATGDPERDTRLADDLARAVDVDVLVSPETAAAAHREALRYVRPAARLAVTFSKPREGFRVPGGQGEDPALGTTVDLPPERASEALRGLSASGWRWLGVPISAARAALSDPGGRLPDLALPAATPRPSAAGKGRGG